MLVLAPVSERPAPRVIARLEHEYSLRNELDADWAVRALALTRHEGRPQLTLEDPGGEPLNRLLGQPMELSLFLRIAIALASALGKLHQRGLIHKDIKPANILADVEGGGVWLAGFGIASRLPRERQSPEPPEVIAGTLAYMAPEQLYGREREIEILLSSFNRVVASGTPELMLVSGYSGIGKSSVVNELHRVLVRPRGMFASGKFDQYKRDIPYATLVQAFQSLVRSFLGQSEAELSRWRDDLREALGPNGQLIVNLIPQLELVIGKQPPVPRRTPVPAKPS